MLARWGSRFGPLARWVDRRGWGASLLARTIGFDRRRSLPSLARQPFARWFRQVEAASQPAAPRGEVALFPDTFTNYFEPQIGIAACRVLWALGYRVSLAPEVCCGRPAISRGLLDRARRLARESVRALGPVAAKGTPIVGLEPSCLFSFRDEIPELVPEEERGAAGNVAQRAVLFDEFLADHSEELARLTGGRGEGAHVLAHGHCHQKTFCGTGPLAGLLGTTGAQVTVADSGCCGMAGKLRLHLRPLRDLARHRRAPALPGGAGTRDRGRAGGGGDLVPAPGVRRDAPLRDPPGGIHRAVPGRRRRAGRGRVAHGTLRPSSPLPRLRRVRAMNDDRREVRIAAILGTTRPGNVTSKVLALAVDELSGNPEVRVTWIDPAEMELPFPGQSGDFPDRERLQAAIREADGLIFATPEYHGSYAAAMKLVIENLGFPSVLAGKPAALIGAASGAIGAVKALEHLRSVLSHVGAIVLPGPVSVAGVHKVFDAEGRCLDEAVERRTRKLAANLLDYVERSTCPRAGLEAFARRG